jgi:predicted MFS family arabinose efflux permease
VRPKLHTPIFWYACGVHFTGAMGLAMFILFPLYVRALAGSEWTIGLITGVGYVAAVLARLPLEPLLDRLGRRGVLVGAGALHVAGCLLFLTTASLGVWLVVVTVIHGIAAGVLFAAYFIYAADIVPAERRAEGTAVFGLAGLLANGLAPALGERVIRRGGFGAFFLVAAGWAAVSFVMSFRLVEAGRLAGTAARLQRSIVRVVRDHGLGPIMLTTLTFGVGVTSVFTFLAPFAATLDLGSVGGFFACYAGAAALVRTVGGRLPDAIGLRRVLLPALALLGTGLFGLIGAGRHPAVLPAAGAACGAAHGYIFPILNALAVARAPREAWGAVVSLYTAMFDLGSVIGAPVLGAIALALGYQAMYLAAAAIGIAGFLIMAFGDGGRERAVQADRLEEQRAR